MKCNGVDSIQKVFFLSYIQETVLVTRPDELRLRESFDAGGPMIPERTQVKCAGNRAICPR